MAGLAGWVGWHGWTVVPALDAEAHVCHVVVSPHGLVLAHAFSLVTGVLLPI
jgi:hypothetical protein